METFPFSGNVSCVLLHFPFIITSSELLCSFSLWELTCKLLYIADWTVILCLLYFIYIIFNSTKIKHHQHSKPFWTKSQQIDSWQLKLVRVNPPEAEFKATYNASYAVFRKYQLEVHHDSESECDKMSYQGFLVDGPLLVWPSL